MQCNVALMQLIHNAFSAPIFFLHKPLPAFHLNLL
nr:MAG TPA: hypothetical protein [Caudoviricetes sp.]